MFHHPAYRAAKSGASAESAHTLVSDCIADAQMDRITTFLNGRRPRVVGVHSEESGGRNKIPTMYAEVLAGVLNLDTDPGIVQSTVANHSEAPSIYHRFVSPPLFDGYVEPGADYLIVDDTCTAGGTLANLKGFIEASGGRVAGMSVLALPNVALRYEISLAQPTLKRLMMRHPSLGAYWMEEFGHDLEGLTEGEAGHLLSAPSFDTIRNRLTEARRDCDLARSEAAHSRAVETSEELDQCVDEYPGSDGG